MGRRVRGENLLQQGYLVVVFPSGRLLPVQLDGINEVALTIVGPVAKSVPLFVELQHLQGEHVPVLGEILFALRWGYMVRALPRRGGPAGKEAARG